MNIGRSKWTERVHPSHELDRLQLATKIQFHRVPERNAVRSRQRQCLQGMEIVPGSGKPTNSQCHRRMRAIRECMRVGRAQNGIWSACPVAQVSVESQRTRGKHRAFQRETRTHIGRATVAVSSRAGDKRDRAFQLARITVSVFAGDPDLASIGQNPQYWPIRCRAQRPLPVIVFSSAPFRGYLESFKDRTQGYVYQDACARSQPKAFPYRWQEG